jgi:hypothetical protein
MVSVSFGFGYFAKLNLTQNLPAVTIASLVMRKGVLKEARRFDEKKSACRI